MIPNVPYYHPLRRQIDQTLPQTQSVSPIRFNDTYRSTFQIGHPALTMETKKPEICPLNQDLARSVLLTSLNFDNTQDR